MNGSSELLLIRNMFLKSGKLYKLGEGPINYDWNARFFVLDSMFCHFTLSRASSGADLLRE